MEEAGVCAHRIGEEGSKIQEEVSAMARSAEEDLAKAEPAVEAAMAALAWGHGLSAAAE